MFEPNILNLDRIKQRYDDLIFQKYGPEVLSRREKARLEEELRQQERREKEIREKTESFSNNYINMNRNCDSLLYVNTRDDQFDRLYNDSRQYPSSNVEYNYLNPELQHFVNQHDIVMHDGGFIPKDETVIKGAKGYPRLKCKCSRRTIFLLIGVFLVTLALSIAAILLSLYIINRSDNYPKNEFWWQRAFYYHLDVRTFANDVGGSNGRMSDAISRIPYVKNVIGANAIILSGLIENDPNGITDFSLPAEYLNQESFRVDGVIEDLKTKAKTKNEMKLLLGLDIYKTSDQSSYFINSRQDSQSTYYIWTDVKPEHDSQRRIYAFDATRNMYYRHVHGNIHSPLLNLSDANVISMLQANLLKHQKLFSLDGFYLVNSTNIIPDFYEPLKNIMSCVQSDQSIWFLDDADLSRSLNDGRLVSSKISLKSKVQLRSLDIRSQLEINDKNVPENMQQVWYASQESENNIDYQTLQALELFLPSSFLMNAGEEVHLFSGHSELIKWKYINDLNYETYYPINIDPVKSKKTLDKWKSIQMNIKQQNLLSTSFTKSPYQVIDIKDQENELLLRRRYLDTGAAIYFLTSFQTLNTKVNIASTVEKESELIFDSKSDYTSSTFNIYDFILKNNQILLLKV